MAMARWDDKKCGSGEEQGEQRCNVERRKGDRVSSREKQNISTTHSVYRVLNTKQQHDEAQRHTTPNTNRRTKPAPHHTPRSHDQNRTKHQTTREDEEKTKTHPNQYAPTPRYSSAFSTSLNPFPSTPATLSPPPLPPSPPPLTPMHIVFRGLKPWERRNARQSWFLRKLLTWRVR